jgi:hypothetical protein
MIKMTDKRDDDETPTNNDYDMEINNQKSILAGMIPPPLPILPKQVPDYEKPKCPIEHIKFMYFVTFSH